MTVLGYYSLVPRLLPCRKTGYEARLLGAGLKYVMLPHTAAEPLLILYRAALHGIQLSDSFLFCTLLALASQCSLVISVVNVESLFVIPGFFLLSTGGFAGALQLPAHLSLLPVVGSALEAAHLSQ